MINIKVKLENNLWTNALDYQIEAFIEFKINKYNDYIYDKNNIKFTLSRIGDKLHGPIYLIRENNSAMPICDWNNVKIFINISNIVNWYNTENFLTEAYFDFIYSNQSIGNYNCNEIGSYIISRNTNNSIYYEIDNGQNNKIRISDNCYARAGYLGFYHRMTNFIDIDMSIKKLYLTLPSNLIINYTENVDKFCIICNNIEQNIKFLSCHHTLTCSECYKQLKNPTECPICKQVIKEIIKFEK